MKTMPLLTGPCQISYRVALMVKSGRYPLDLAAANRCNRKRYKLGIITNFARPALAGERRARTQHGIDEVAYFNQRM